MRTRILGRTGRAVPTIGLGTWNMEQDDGALTTAAIQRAIELGLVHVDTAELYGNGRVETLLGLALDGIRDRVFLVSKVLPTHATRKGTVAACEQSLRRLRTDHLDLYLLHWESEHPIGDTIAAFEDLEAAGKVLAWGVSNFDERGLAEVEALAPGRMACNQVLYHLGERAIEHAVLPWCIEHQVAVVGYSPFGSGDFPTPRSSGGRTLQRIADRHGATPRQVALQFLVRKDPLFAIPKASSVAHVDDNAGADRVVLSPQDLQEIESSFPLGRRRSGVPTL